jgi:Arc/MetJ-type ribon-helix-helix transcriptional regulator
MPYDTYGTLARVHKTTIYLPDDLRRELDAAAQAAGQSQADLIRRAVRAYLGDQPQRLPASVGGYGGGAFAARDDEAVLEASWGPRRADGS